MAIKIAISGAFSSGKTTLFSALTREFGALTGYPELASPLKANIPTINWWNDDVRGYLRWAQILSERQSEQGRRIGIFDGSFADLVAHERVFGTTLPPIAPENVPSRYALTLLCDASEIPIEINGIRETDQALRTKIQEMLHEEVYRISDRVVELRGDRQQRYAQAAAEVAQILSQT